MVHTSKDRTKQLDVILVLVRLAGQRGRRWQLRFVSKKQKSFPHGRCHIFLGLRLPSTALPPSKKEQAVTNGKPRNSVAMTFVVSGFQGRRNHTRVSH